MTFFILLCILFPFIIKQEVEAEFSSEPFISITNLSEDLVFNGFKKTVKREVLPIRKRTKRFSNEIYDNVEAAVFLNLPYAEPLRMETAFKKAEPVSKATYNKLKVSRQYRKFGNVCPQDPAYIKRYSSFLGMDYDCLTLNVFAPATNLTKLKYPVYVLLHGGNFVRGSAMDFGLQGLITNFVAADIVVVTVNYRLGAYGFSNIPKVDEQSEGRSVRGFYDQLLALQWVQTYIQNFGGDESAVTLGGFSSGSSSAAMLTHYTLNKGRALFRSVILHGGSADTGRYSGITSHSFEKELKHRLGCEGNNTEAQQECLVERCFEDIVSETTKIAPYGLEFSVPDGDFLAPSNYSSKDAPKYKMKILYGINKDEFYKFERELHKEIVASNIPATLFGSTDIVNKTFMLLLNPRSKHSKKTMGNLTRLHNIINETEDLLEDVFNHYFKGKQKDLYNSINKLFTDYIFTTNMVEEAKKFSTAGHSVWFYKFVYAGVLENQYKNYVTHGADVNYAYMSFNNDWKKVMDHKTSKNNAHKEKSVSINLARTLTYFIKHQELENPRFTPDFLNCFKVKEDNVKCDKKIIEPEVLRMWEKVSRKMRTLKLVISKNFTKTLKEIEDSSESLLSEAKQYEYKDYNYRAFDFYNYDYKNYKEATYYNSGFDPARFSNKPVLRVGGSLVNTLNAIADAYKAMLPPQ